MINKPWLCFSLYPGSPSLPSLFVFGTRIYWCRACVTQRLLFGSSGTCSQVFQTRAGIGLKIAFVCLFSLVLILSSSKKHYPLELEWWSSSIIWLGTWSQAALVFFGGGSWELGLGVCNPGHKLVCGSWRWTTRPDASGRKTMAKVCLAPVKARGDPWLKCRVRYIGLKPRCSIKCWPTPPRIWCPQGIHGRLSKTGRKNWE